MVDARLIEMNNIVESLRELNEAMIDKYLLHYRLFPKKKPNEYIPFMYYSHLMLPRIENLGTLVIKGT